MQLTQPPRQCRSPSSPLAKFFYDAFLFFVHGFEALFQHFLGRIVSKPLSGTSPCLTFGETPLETAYSGVDTGKLPTVLLCLLDPVSLLLGKVSS